MRDVDLAFDPSKRVGLWEPAVIRDGDVFKMWFIYTAGARPTNCLWYATSSDGRAWDLHPQPLLTGGLLGKYRLHYPQVVRTDEGYELYFTLRNQVGRANGLGWSHAHVVNVLGERRMYYHNDNLVPPGRRAMDIGCCEFDGDRCSGFRTVFDTGPRGAWDARFVADPFVLVAD